MTHKRWKKLGDIFVVFKGFSIVGIGDISSSAISSVFWLYVASIMGADQYGQVTYLLAIVGIASTIASLGSQNTITVFTAKNQPLQAPLFLLVLITGCVTSVTIFFVLNNYATSLYVIAVILFGLATAEILGRKQYESYAKYLISQKILMVGLALVLYNMIGMNGIILGIGSSFLIYVVRVYKGLRSKKIDFSLIKPHSRFMMNSYAIDLMSAFNGSIDKIIIAPILGFVALGNYQLGIQFLSITYILPSILSKYLVPEDSSGNNRITIKKASIIFSLVFSILGIILSPIIVPVLFPKYTNVVEIIQITSLAAIPYTVSTIYVSKLLATENTKIILIGSMIYSSAQIITILTLGQIFGVLGIATSYVISITISCLFYYIITKKRNIDSFSQNLK